MKFGRQLRKWPSMKSSAETTGGPVRYIFDYRVNQDLYPYVWGWTPESLPNDWKAQEHRWDLYHWVRTCGLIAAFAVLVVSVGLR